MAGHVGDPARAEVLRRLAEAGRRQSTAAVVLHTVIAERMGLNASDEKLLGLVQQHGPVGHGDLVGATGLSPAAVTGVIDRLVARGYVRRTGDPADARRRRVEVEPAAIAGFGRLWEPLMQRLEETHASYDDAELAAALRWAQDSAAVMEASAGDVPHLGGEEDRHRRR